MKETQSISCVFTCCLVTSFLLSSLYTSHSDLLRDPCKNQTFPSESDRTNQLTYNNIKLSKRNKIKYKLKRKSQEIEEEHCKQNFIWRNIHRKRRSKILYKYCIILFATVNIFIIEFRFNIYLMPKIVHSSHTESIENCKPSCGHIELVAKSILILRKNFDHFIKHDHTKKCQFIASFL